MKKIILLVALTYCIIVTHAASGKNNNTVDDLVKEKSFAVTLQMITDLTSKTIPLLNSGEFNKIYQGKSSREDIRAILGSIGFTSNKGFAEYYYMIHANLNGLRIKYSDIFSNEQMLKEAISKEILSNNLQNKTRKKNEYCLRDFLYSIVACGAALGGDYMAAQTNNSGWKEVWENTALGLWAICLRGAYAILDNCIFDGSL